MTFEKSSRCSQLQFSTFYRFFTVLSYFYKAFLPKKNGEVRTENMKIIKIKIFNVLCKIYDLDFVVLHLNCFSFNGDIVSTDINDFSFHSFNFPLFIVSLLFSYDIFESAVFGKQEILKPFFRYPYGSTPCHHWKRDSLGA